MDPCDIRSIEGICYSMKFLMQIIDDERYSAISDDDKFSYISDRIRAIHTDIIRGNYATYEIYLIIKGAIRFYSLYSFKINNENYKFAKEQLRQWILTLQDYYNHVDISEFGEDEETAQYELVHSQLEDILERILFLDEIDINALLPEIFSLLDNEILEENEANEIEEDILGLSEIVCALKKCEYTRVKNIITNCFPVTVHNLVIHALFRMKLIDMRHAVFRKWARSNFPNFDIPISYVTEVLMYDNEDECIEDIVSCKLDIKESMKDGKQMQSFIPKMFDERDCLLIARNKSQQILQLLESDKLKDEGLQDMGWGEYFYTFEEDYEDDDEDYDGDDDIIEDD